MIELADVWKYYGDAVALRELSLAIAPGEAVILTGPSGAGKSTLLRLLYVAERAERGRVMLVGRDVARLTRQAIPFLRRNIGVVFQDFKLIPNRTVYANVSVALEILGLKRSEQRSRVETALAAVGLLDKIAMPAAKLSGGEQQRVAVARAIVGEPAIILADEPTGNLDPIRALELLDLFEGLRVRGVTLVVATHDPDVIRFGLSHSWRRIRLERGGLSEAAPTAVLDCDPTERKDAKVLRLVEVY